MEFIRNANRKAKRVEDQIDDWAIKHPKIATAILITLWIIELLLLFIAAFSDPEVRMFFAGLYYNPDCIWNAPAGLFLTCLSGGGPG